MTNARAIKAGRGFIELFLQDNAVLRGLRRLNQRLRALSQQTIVFGAALASIGTAALTPLAALAKEFADFGDIIDKTSRRIFVFPEVLSALKFGIEQSGGTIQDLERGFFGLSRSIFQLELGTQTAKDAYEQLGLAFEDVANRSPVDQLRLVADGLKDITDESTRGAVAQLVLGRAGRQLLPFLADGARGIDAFIQEARDLRLIVGRDGTAAAAELTDAMNRVVSVFRAVRLAIGQVVAGPLSEFLDQVTEIAVFVVDWTRSNAELVTTFARLAAVTVAVGGGIVAIGVSIGVLSFAIGSIVSVITGFATLLGGIGAAFAALATPIGLSVTAIGSAVTAFLTLSQVGRRVAQSIFQAFTSLRESFTSIIGAIINALLAGQIEQAARVLFAALQVVFLQGTTGLLSIWSQFQTEFLQISNTAAEETLKAFTITFTAIASVVERFKQEVLGAFDAFVTGITVGANKAFTEIQNALQEALDVRVLVPGGLEKVRDQISQRTRQREAQRQRELEQFETRRFLREEARRAKINQMTRQSEQQIALIREGAQRNREQLADRNRDAIAAAQREAEKARELLATNIDLANEAKLQLTDVGLDPNAFRQDIDGLLETVQQSAAQVINRGPGAVFASELAGLILGTGNEIALQRSIADNTERTADAAEATANNTKDGGTFL